MKIKAIWISLILCTLFTSCELDTDINTLEGSWLCTETSEIFKSGLKGTSIYPVYIARDTADENVYYFDNFYQLGDAVLVKAMVSGRSITIEKQTVDGIEFVGSGTVNASYDEINLSYTADDGGGEIDHVQASYSR